MTLKYKLTVVLTILFLVLFIDQATKIWAIENLRGQGAQVYLNGLIQLVYAENAGAFLSFGAEWSREIRFIVFAVVVFFGLGGMGWYLFKKESSRLNLFAYSFILAGGVGNLWDRVYRDHGHVVDFLFIDIWGPLKTGVVNVADMAIVLGVVIAIFVEFKMQSTSKKTV